MSFRVGQKVVCVDDTSVEGSRWFPGSQPKKGVVHTVREVGRTVRGFVGLQLQEIKLQAAFGFYSHQRQEDAFYRADRFRPVIERKTETGMAVLRKIASDITTKINEKV